MGYQVASGRGSLYSFTVVHHPQVPGFRYPLLVGLIELDEDVRIVANLVGVTRDDVEVGMPLEVEWLDSHPALGEGATDSRGPISLPQVRPATPPRRQATVAAGKVHDGHKL